MQKVLIYDDNINHCAELQKLLVQYGVSDIETAQTYEAAVYLLNTKKFTVLFLDIELENGQSGIAFAAQFQKQFPDAALVYITAHIRYCEEIFVTTPTAFLLKPFTAEKVKRTMEIISQKKEKISITLTFGKKIIRIPLTQVAYMESIHRHLLIFDSGDSCIGEYYGIRLDDVATQLPKNFLRCHQSIIVNMAQIVSFRSYVLTLENGTELPISQSRYKNAKQKYLAYLGETL